MGLKKPETTELWSTKIILQKEEWLIPPIPMTWLSGSLFLYWQF